MSVLFFVSSNSGKLQEYQKLLSPFAVQSLNLSLEELQIEQLKQLCEHKLEKHVEKTEGGGKKQAMQQIGGKTKFLFSFFVFFQVSFVSMFHAEQH